VTAKKDGGQKDPSSRKKISQKADGVFEQSDEAKYDSAKKLIKDIDK
jgi:hypothetical protein